MDRTGIGAKAIIRLRRWFWWRLYVMDRLDQIQNDQNRILTQLGKIAKARKL